MTYINRFIEAELKKRLGLSPVVAILGPRQCGKSTLAKKILQDGLYLDLENPDDLQKLQSPTLFLEENQDKLICLDEIQRAPHFFEILRSHVDKTGKNGQILILGSASKNLIQQSSESLAGRISYLNLSPFLAHELSEIPLKSLWLKGGFPRSILAKNDDYSMIWRSDFIQSYLERDIPQLGFKISTSHMQRLWRMLAHLHGQVLNKSKLAGSLGIDSHTVQGYIDILKDTYMINIMEPYHSNTKKRLIKSPKLYISDSGILHALLKIDRFNDLLGHPDYGASWEGLVVQTVLQLSNQWHISYYRTSNDVEIDLILERGSRKIAIEIKASSAPKLATIFHKTIEELNITESYVVAPIKASFPLSPKTRTIPITDLVTIFT